MTDVAENVETTAEQKRLDIINGRMPLPLVYLIRFDEGDLKDSEVAAKYFTSTGKVNDIRKGRNFAYITEETKFTKADIDGAMEFIKKPSLQGNHIADKTLTSIRKALRSLPVDEAAAAAITEARKAARKSAKPAEEKSGGEDLADKV